MIFKVQVTRNHNHPNTKWMILVYNEDRSIRFEGPAEQKLVNQIRGLGSHFQGEPSNFKVFLEGELLPQVHDDVEIQFTGEAPWQEW